jgi:hypothetical protein
MPRPGERCTYPLNRRSWESTRINGRPDGCWTARGLLERDILPARAISGFVETHPPKPRWERGAKKESQIHGRSLCRRLGGYTYLRKRP